MWCARLTDTEKESGICVVFMIQSRIIKEKTSSALAFWSSFSVHIWTFEIYSGHSVDSVAICFQIGQIPYYNANLLLIIIRTVMTITWLISWICLICRKLHIVSCTLPADADFLFPSYRWGIRGCEKLKKLLMIHSQYEARDLHLRAWFPAQGCDLPRLLSLLQVVGKRLPFWLCVLWHHKHGYTRGSLASKMSNKRRKWNDIGTTFIAEGSLPLQVDWSLL